MNRRSALRSLIMLPAAAPAVSIPTVGISTPEPNLIDQPAGEWTRYRDWWITWTGFREHANSLHFTGFWMAYPAAPGHERKRDRSRRPLYLGINGAFDVFEEGYNLNTDWTNRWICATIFDPKEKLAWLRKSSLAALLEILSVGRFQNIVSGAAYPGWNYDERRAVLGKCSERTRAFLDFFGYVDEKYNGFSVPNEVYATEAKRMFGEWGDV